MIRKSFHSGLKIRALIGLVAVTFLAGLSLTGCGGSASVSVAVTAAASSVDGSDSTKLTATLTNDSNNAGVSWSVSGGGALSNTTTTSATYTAPAPSSSPLTVTITATSVADTSKTASVKITVAAAPAITIGALTAGTVGTTYTATLTVTGGIAPYTWSLASGTLPTCLTITQSSSGASITGTLTASCAGTYKITLEATDSGTPTPLTATTAALSLTINAAPAIAFTGVMPATATYNTPYTGSAAATGGAGTLTYSTLSGALPTGLSLNTSSGGVTGTPTVVGPFNFTIKAADAFGDSANQAYAIAVNLASPTLVFAAIPTKTYGNAPFTVSASSASNGTITYSVTSGPATINSSTGLVTLTGAGTVVLGASQAATADYAAATASTSFTVSPEVPTLTFAAIPTETYGNAPFTVSASSASSGAITYSVTSGPATINSSSGLVTLTGAGAVMLGASQAASGNYAAATASTSFTVNPETPTLVFAAIPTQTYGNAPFTASASSASTGAITYSVTSGPATINSSTGLVTLTGVGTVMLGASQAASGNYAVATASTSFTVNQGTPTLVFAAIPTQAYGNAPFTASASSASNGAITYSVTSGPATINSSTGLVTLTGVGTVMLGASQAATADYIAATASTSFTVNQGTPTLVFAAIPTQTYGNAAFTASASSASTGAITYSVTSGPATINSSTGLVTLTGVGTVMLGASQVATADYAAATASISFIVNPEAVTLTFAAIPTHVYGDAAFTASASSVSSGAITYSVTSGPATINSSTGLVTLTGSGTVVLGASQAASGNYAAATASTSFTVNPALSITTTSPLPTGVVNTQYSQTLMATGGTGGYAWATNTAGTTSLATVNLTLSTGGVVSGKPAGTGSATFAATVTDSTSHTATVTFTVQITNALTITSTSASLPAAYTNALYSQTLTAAGGTGLNYVWSVSGTSNLSTFNMTLSAGGVLSGTPTTTGTATFTAQVKDSGGNIATQALSIPVYNPIALPAANPSSLPSAIVGQLYSGTITATGGSGSGYVFTVTGLPNDSLQNAANNGSSTLSIGGTPTTVTASGSPISFQVSVKDSLGNSTGPVTYTVAVVPPAPLTLPAGGSLPAATDNVAYNGSIVASGGSGSGYVFAINGVSVPTNGTSVPLSDSLSVSSTGTSTLSIGGTPTQTAEINLTNVTVKDGAGDTAGPVSYSIASNPPSPLTLPTTTSLPAATTNVAYSGGISASGGTGSGYVFSINGTAVPITGALVAISDSISVSSNGGSTLSISGTPTATGTVTLTNVTVNDSGGDTAGPITYTIQVNSPGSPVSGQITLINYCNNNNSLTLPTFTVSINTTPVQTTTTDNNGNYSFATVPNGTYTITPSITGATSLFYPATLTNVVIANNSVSGENFNATVGYTVSGTVGYGGAATGPIYVDLNNNNCGGSSAANGVTITAPGAFSIRGVSPGSYTLNSWRDNLGYGQPNASDPTATVSNLTVSNAAVTGVAVGLADPGAVSLSAAPTLETINGFTDGVVVNFKPILNNNQVELPTSYTVQWNTTNSFTSPAGSHSFPASGDNTDLWILNTANVTGLSSGSSYYFRVQGVAGSSTSNWSSTVGPIKLAEATAANTVTGQVAFTGTATGPLYVGFYDQSTSQVWTTQVGSKTAPPTSPASYTVEVPSGSYGLFAIIDQNNNGLIDPGDITNVYSGGNGPQNVTISGSTTENVTLPSTASTVSVTTQYSPNTIGGIAADYNLNFDVRESVKLPIAASLVSGPNLIEPVDMGGCGSNCGTPQFQYYANTGGYLPKVGDSYSFHVAYSDGTSETLNGTVTGVLGASALPTLISPTGTGISDSPSFDWTYPSSAGSYTYQFSLCCGNNGTIWSIPGNHSNSNGFTSLQITPPLVWGVDPTDGTNLPSPSTLSAGNYYNWSLQATDTNGNSANAQMNFQTVPGPVSLPAATTNPLPSGVVNVGYSGTLNASGGAGGGNYYFVVNSTTIPTNNTFVSATNSDGLTFANSGGNTLFVSGTPSSAMSVSLTIEVVDTSNSSDTATVTYTVVINAQTPVSLPADTSNPLGSAVVSMPYGASLNASGGSGSYSFTVNGTTIPTNSTYVTAANSDGLTFANSSGNTLFVAGTPASVASVSLDVVVTDTNNSSDTATVTYTLPVVSPPSGVNNSHLNGTYVCKTNMNKDSNGSALASVGSLVFDGNGNITSGIFDMNGVGFSSALSGTNTGTYSIGADNNGLATTNFTVTAGGTGSGSNTWAIALTDAVSPAQEFRMVETDDIGATPSGQNGTADCYLATTSAFAASTISAKGFAFGMQGVDGSDNPKFHVGRMTDSTATGSGSSATGTITSGYIDGMGLNQTGDNGGAFTGSYTGPNSNGRFTFALTPTAGGGSSTFVAYIIDANRMFVLETAGDSGVRSGEMRTQQQTTYSNASINAAAVLYGQGLESSGSGVVSGFDSQIYQVSGNGAGTLTVNQSYDDNNGTYAEGKENGAAVTVTFDSTNPGRATFSPGSDSAFLYFYNTNSAFYLDLNGGGSPNFLEAGWLEPQTQTTFTDAALAGTYLFTDVKIKPGDTSVGEMTLSSGGTVTGSVSTGGQNTFSFDSAQAGLSYSLSNPDTYGAYSLTEAGQSGGETCMVITASKDICMDGTGGSANMSVLQQ